ncbi:MAG: hypothetical protein KC609_19915 [Myxococcales bacterium]|nr:hypothetical protein [Myxococcales bacterium]
MAAIRAENSSSTCPYCRDTIDPQADQRVCQICLTRHHAECWISNGERCAVFGCGSSQALAPEASAPSAPRGVSSSPSSFSGGQPYARSPTRPGGGAQRASRVAVVAGAALVLALGAAVVMFTSVSPGKKATTTKSRSTQPKTTAPLQPIAPVAPTEPPRPAPTPRVVTPRPTSPPHDITTTKSGVTVTVKTHKHVVNLRDLKNPGRTPFPVGTSNETLQLVIQHASEIGVCSARRRDHSQAISFTARLKVAANGTITAVSFFGLDAGESAIKSCLDTEMRRWKLAAGKPRTVNLPLTVR